MKRLWHGLNGLALGMLLSLFSPETNAQESLDSVLFQLFSQVPDSLISSGLLADQHIWFSDPRAYDGTDSAKICQGPDDFFMLYSGFSRAVRSTAQWPSSEEYLNQIEFQEDGLHLLGLDVRYEAFSTDPTELADLELVSGSVTPQSGSWPIIQERTALITLSRSVFQESLTIELMVDSHFFTGNGSSDWSSLSLDKGDGSPPIALLPGSNILTWLDTGSFVMLFEWLDDTGESVKARSSVHFRGNPSSTAYFWDSQADTSIEISSGSGLNLLGELQIKYGCGHDRLIRPLIICEGFNPRDLFDRQYSDLFYDLRYLLTEYQRPLLQELPDEQYDLVYVDLKGSEEDIRENAKVLRAVLEWINAEKRRNGSSAENVLIGASMGGLVANIALREMEIDGKDHECALYVSYDTPHLGANVPLGIQALLHDLHYTKRKGKPLGDGVALVENGVAAITSPSARQMLKYHMFANGSTLNLPFVNQTSIDFYDFLDSLGLPQNTRKNIAISNGNVVGDDQGFTEGYTLLTVAHDQYFGLAKLRATAFSAKCNSNAPIYERRIFFDLGIIEVDLDTRTINSGILPCYDRAPGGAQGMDALGGGGNSFVDPYIAQYGFIPVVSALRIEAKWNTPFYAFSGQDITPSGLGITEFDTIYCFDHTHYDLPRTTDNEFHVELTPSNYEFFREWMLPAYELPSGSALLGHSFNIARYRNQWVQASVSDLYVLAEFNGDSTILFVNKDDRLADMADLSSPQGQEGHIQVELDEACSGLPAGILIQAGGKLELGEDPSRTASLLINDGEIYVQSGGKLIVNTGSQLVIGEEGVLHIEDGALIEFRPGAKLHVQGKIEFDQDAHLSLLEGSILIYDVDWSKDHQDLWVYDQSNEITLKGSGIADTILEVRRAPFGLRKGFGNLTIKNGTIYMAEATHISHGAPLDLRNVRMTTKDGQRHDGIKLWGQDDVYIFDLEVDNATTAIKANLTAQGHPLKIQGLQLHDCLTAFYTRGKSVEISTAQIHHNEVGWKAEDMEALSILSDVDLDDNISAVEFLGQTGSSLMVEDSRIRDNSDFGISVEGADLSLRCSVVKNNGLDGIYLTEGRLFIGEEASNRFEDNEIGIHLSEAEELYLDYGGNRFISNSAYHIYADLNSTAPGVYSTQNGLGLSANQNEFTMVGYGASQQLPVHIEIAPNASTVDLTGNWAPQIISCGINQAIGQYDEIQMELDLLTGSESINTLHINGKSIPQAVSNAIDLLNVPDSAGILLSIHQLFEAMVYPLASANQADLLARDYAYKLIFEAYGLAIRNGYLPGGEGQYSADNDPFVQEVDSVIRLSINELGGQDQDYFKKLFQYRLDAGLIMRLGEYYTEAESIFQDSLNWTGNNLAYRAEYWECVCTAEHDLLIGLVEAEAFEEALMNCNLLIQNERPFRPMVGNYQNFNTDRLGLTLVPNPGSDRVLMPGYSGSAKIQFFDVTGRCVLEQEFRDASRFISDTRGILPGTYLIQLELEGQILYGQWIRK